MSNRKNFAKLRKSQREAMDKFSDSWVIGGYKRRRDMDKFSASFAGESEPRGLDTIKPIRPVSGKRIKKPIIKRISMKKSRKKSQKNK